MDKILLREVCKGLLTHFPALSNVLPSLGAGGGTRSASYCYGVWMKHMAFLLTQTDSTVPKYVAELGPGNSLGVGYAMLLGGVDRYSAFDVVEHASDRATALAVFDDLHTLITQRSARPVKGWPDFDEHLDETLFPSDFFTDALLDQTLASDKVVSLRAAVEGDASSQYAESISYVAPWSDVNVQQENIMDLVFSHSVLEYMDDLDACYQSQWKWLRPGGYISHQIDLTGHSLSKNWDGFRGYGEKTWSTMRGNRPFWLNRQPCSAHIAAIEKAGFEIVVDLRRRVESQTAPDKKWSHLGEDDLTTSGLFIQARKPIERATRVPG